MSKIHILQHVPYETPSVIGSYFRNNGAAVGFTRFYMGEELPSYTDFDWLIIMGGPMSVTDEQHFPWLKDEKKFIREVIQSGKKLLGVCLGAQLIASALGAAVYKNTYPEIGWFPIFRQREAENSTLGFLFPEKIEVFHWHGDTFDLPSGSTLLASSVVCKNQAFSLADRVVGLQFHLEVTKKDVHRFIDNNKDEPDRQPYIQSAEEMLDASHKFTPMNKLMIDILDAMTKQI